jgi:hypothetical protein
MVFYNVEYNGSFLKILSDDEEMSTKRLKNHILRNFDKITYDNLELFLKEDNTTFNLDDNELVDYSQSFILEIDTDF